MRTGPILAAAAVLLLGSAALTNPPAPNERGGPPTPSSGTNQIDRLLRELETTRGSLANPELSPEEHVRARAREDSLLASLIEAAPHDHRTPSWMLDRAEAVLESQRARMTDLSVLHGLPTREQRRDLARAAWECVQLTVAAQDAAQRAVRELQAPLLDGASRRMTPEEIERADEVLSALISDVLGRRVPLLRGRSAALLGAAVDHPSERAEFARLAVESLEPLALTDPIDAARRDLALGAAILIETGAQRPLPDQRSRARTIARRTIEALADARHPSLESLLFESRLLLLRSARTSDDASALALALRESTQHSPDNSAKSILREEAIARALLSDHALPEEGAEDRFRFALSRLLAAASPREQHAEAPDPSLRARVYQKIGPLLPRGLDYARLEPDAAFARALAVGRDRAGRSESLALLAHVADRNDAGPLRADALWEAAVLLAGSDDPEDMLNAADVLCMLVEEFPDDARARQAADEALRLVEYVGASTRPGARLAERAVQVRLTALAAAYRIAEPGPAGDELRLKRARALLAQGSPDPRVLADVLSSLAGVQSGVARRDADALAVDAIELALDAAAASPDPDKRHSATADIARRAIQWANERSPARADRYRLLLADALLALRDARALPIYWELLRADPLPDGTTRDALRLSLARAQRLAGHETAAFESLRSLVDGLRRPATADDHAHDLFWGAWAELLELLAGRNTDGEHSGTIRLRIRNLELIDPELGGDPYRARIRAVGDGL